MMRLPAEIIERIINELAEGLWSDGHAVLYGESQDNIQAASLVSKEWRLAAQRLLFASRSFLGYRQDLDRFIRYWGPFRCKSLCLELDRDVRCKQEDAIILWQHELATRMQDLRCFQLKSCDDRIYQGVAHLLLWATNLRALVCSFEPNLNINGEQWDPATHFHYSDIQGLPSLLSRMKNLRYLVLDRALLQTPVPAIPDIASPSPCASLRTLTLNSCVLGDADLLTLLGPQSSITSLTLVDLAGPSEAALTAALASIAMQVESLCLAFPAVGRQGRRDYAVQQGLISADQRAASNYTTSIRQVLPSCRNLRKLGLHKAGVIASDLENLSLLQQLFIDVSEGLWQPGSPIPPDGLANGSWLPSLQALVLERPNMDVWSDQDSEWMKEVLIGRGATYAENPAGHTQMTRSFAEGEVPDATRMLLQ